MNVIWKRDLDFDLIMVTGAQFFMNERPPMQTNGIRGDLEFRREKKTARLGPLGELAHTSRGETPPQPQTVYGMYSLKGELFGVQTGLMPGDTFRLLDNGIGSLVVDATVILEEVCFNEERSIKFVLIGEPKNLWVKGINLLEILK